MPLVGVVRSSDQGPGGLRMKERPNPQWNPFVLKGLDGFGMNHRRSVIRHFHGFEVRKGGQKSGHREEPGIGVHDPVHVFPNP